MDFSCNVKPNVTTPAVAGAGGAASSLVQRWQDFRRSGAPVRLLCFENGAWADVAAEATAALRRAFAEGRAIAEAADGGRRFLFDFLRMARVDSCSGEASALGWIDELGRCFFPTPPCARKRKRGEEEEEWKEEAPSVVEERSDETMEAEKKKARARWGKAERLQETDRFYQVVKKLFLSGMAPVRRPVEVTAVHRSAHGRAGARIRAFQMQGRLIAAARGGSGGSANVKFAWYGAPARDVAVAVEHGFGRTNSALLGARAHGDGVHLSPAQFSYPSAALAETDESGEAHIVLCRVVMGRPEAVPAGSPQFHPSSDDYDSGVDSVPSPRWYVVWSTHMNTHILPEYVVSFRFSKLQRQGSSELSSVTKRSSPANASVFPKLLAEIERCLPSSKVQTLERSYNSFKRGGIKKEDFIRFLRGFVGDRLLAMVAKKLRGY